MNELVLSVRGLALAGDKLSRSRVRSLVAAALPAGGEVALRFVKMGEMRDINVAHRGKHAAADVLAFAYHAAGEAALGDIAICPQTAGDDARRRGRSSADHFSHLIVHGALHLAGWRHNTLAAAAAMENKEREILSRFGVADPYCLAADAKKT